MRLFPRTERVRRESGERCGADQQGSVMRLVRAVLLLVSLVLVAGRAAAQETGSTEAKPDSTHADAERWSSFLPLLGEEATKRGIELPLPFGAGFVYYYLSRDIEITDVRVGRNGAPPASVSEFAQLSAHANVSNVNVKFDVWLLPFFNVYLIGGYIKNHSETRIDVTLPPLLPGGAERRRTVTAPTSLEGSVGGVGTTLAGGYGPFFMIYDASFAQADLGFDSRFKAVVTSVRAGWNGKLGSRPFRTWASATDWNTFATATGTVGDPDGGSLAFEVDQGPAYRYTYGAGAHYSAKRWLEFAADVGTDGHGGWYLALIPVFRF